MRLQVPRLREWEAAHVPDPFLSAAAGRSPVDPVWRAEVAAEVSVAEGQVASLVSVDLQAFYEHIRHEDLVVRALGLSFPLAVLRCALRAYRCNRHILHLGLVSQAVASLKGIIAGCSAATSLVKAYYAEPFRAVLRRWHQQSVSLFLSVYLDDITVAGIHSTAADSGRIVAAGVADIREVVEHELHCQIAPTKTVVLSSSKAAAAELAHQVGGGDHAVRPLDAAAMLGVEVKQAAAWRLPAAAGRPRLRSVRHTDCCS